MKFTVNSKCIGCGLCVTFCPEVFEINYTGKAVAAPVEVDSYLETKALDAKERCPANAIEAE